MDGQTNKKRSNISRLSSEVCALLPNYPQYNGNIFTDVSGESISLIFFKGQESKRISTIRSITTQNSVDLVHFAAEDRNHADCFALTDSTRLQSKIVILNL